VGLAALPSSLLLGVTTHLSTDVAAAPFLWAAPLALYLVTFIVAFQAKPAISSDRALFWHGGLAAVCAAQFMLNMGHWALMLALNLSAFFFAALVCHQMLKARRPSPERLTEFFLLVSVGGALGGALTAFVAPQVFSGVWEYPLAIVLTALIRPRRGGAFSRLALVSLGVGAISLLAAVGLRLWDGPVLALQACALGMVASAFLLRDRPWAFTLLLAGLAAQAGVPAAGSQRVSAERGFFGVLEVSREADDQVGPVHALYHGTTLHGAQALAPAARCTPMTYYAPATAIGQTFAFMHGQRPSARMGVVGLGAGSVASYVRPSDSLRFFEIDPLVVRIASDPSRFTFLSECARGPVSIELGDARLTVGRQAPGGFDLLVVDAFSSDSVPTHLLTQEAVELYLDRLAPDGLLVMHLSNRHLKLAPIAAAAARRAGADALVQNYAGPPGGSLRAASSEVLVASRSLETLAALSEDRRWRRAGAEEVRPWTDDYVNLVGALIQGAR
jgi:spermidine synthase